MSSRGHENIILYIAKLSCYSTERKDILLKQFAVFIKYIKTCKFYDS